MSWKMVGLPIAPLPIISPSAPVFSRQSFAEDAEVTSPLAITGILISSAISLICDQSASPEYRCLRVLP